MKGLSFELKLPIALGVLGLACLVQPAVAKDPLKIGVPTIQSGTYAVVGAELLKAIEFAVSEANEKGGVDGRQVEFRALDTEAKPEIARKQAEKLALDGYNVLTGIVTSGETLALMPMLDRWNAVQVISVSKTDAITGANCSPLAFRTNRQDSMDAAVIKPWLQSRKEAKWAVVAADYTWGRGVAKVFRESAGQTGKQVVVELNPQLGTNDFAAFIQQIKASGVDAVWVALGGRDAINFVNQSKEFGLLPSTTMAGVAYITDGSIASLGSVAKGLFAIINYSSTLDTPENKKFVEAWKKKYNGETPSNYQGEQYVGLQIIFQAVERAHSVAPKDIARAIHGGTFDTILGKLTMRPEDNQLTGPNFFGIVDERDGKLRPVITATYSAEQATPPPSGDCKQPSL